MQKCLILIAYLFASFSVCTANAIVLDDEDDVIPRTVQVDMLLQKNNCLTCHEDPKNQIGPRYADVAKKYKGNDRAVSLLTEKIKNGGVGVWGGTPMPPFKFSINDKEIKEIVIRILAM